jgi:hypothetical protein
MRMQETKEEEKERIDRAYAQFDRRSSGRAQASEMMMQSGSLVAKSILLVNGGAAIALLAFLANVFGLSDLDSDRARLLDAVLRSLVYFAWGVFAAVVCMGAAFFANQATVRDYDSEELSFEPPHVRDTAGSLRWRAAYRTFLALAVASAFASTVLFALGVTEVTAVLR